MQSARLKQAGVIRFHYFINHFQILKNGCFQPFSQNSLIINIFFYFLFNRNSIGIHFFVQYFLFFFCLNCFNRFAIKMWFGIAFRFFFYIFLQIIRYLICIIIYYKTFRLISKIFWNYKFFLRMFLYSIINTW